MCCRKKKLENKHKVSNVRIGSVFCVNNSSFCIKKKGI